MAHIQSLANILGCDLPPPPLLYNGSFHEMYGKFTPYYYQCLSIVSRDIRKTVVRVRSTAGSPFAVITKKPPRAKHNTTAAKFLVNS